MHPVRELILQRAKEGSTPLQRRDGFKLGLAIEGGGMRGVVSGGMVTGLHHLGLTRVFDAVYGSSAGAINGAFFLSGQTPYGTTIYYEEINNERFINLRRWLHGSPVMSLEFLLDEVMVHKRPLDWQRLLQQPIPLKIIATSCSRARAEVLCDFGSRDELWEAMRASARIPIVAGPPVPFRGEKYLDATVCESIPYHAALADGCTHVLVLRTRPKGARLGKPSAFTKYIVTSRMASINSAFRDILLKRSGRYDADCEELELANDKPEGSGPHLMSVFPSPQAPTVSRMETDRAALVAGACDGAASAVEAVIGERPSAVEVIQPFNLLGWPYARVGGDAIGDHRGESLEQYA